jgi:signal transduction histidine kinase
MNIFDNGVKYGLPGEMIEANYWIKSNTGELIVEILGKSVGFNQEEDVFALGTRGKAAQEKTSSGTGLGLNICKLIIENVFKGKIAGEHSRATKITKFTIWLPGGYEI